MGKKYDFSGWATKNDLLCSDGRVIRKDAFKDNDGQVVPVVWNHQHNDPMNVLGHALLENRNEGVYAYITLNDTDAGVNARKLVEHGDITSLSIYANRLKESGKNVLHGAIREVSLVLAGANPGAFIDSVIAHSDDSDGEAIIYTGEEFSLMHSEEEPETKKEDGKDKEMKDEKLNEKEGAIEHADKPATEPAADTSKADDSGETVEDVFNTLSEKQKNVVYALIGQAIEDSQGGDGTDDTANESAGGEQNMKHNVFDGEENNDENAISHSEMVEVINDAKRFGSMKESAIQHGITDIDFLFPDAQNVTNTPGFISRDTGWVSNVMGGTHHTPFSRIKSMFADITEDDARAKGYIKGKLKKDEVFSLLKRTTTPTTVYKKQKLDRDDVIDITDFDVVAWLKSEMRVMLDEELARAILVGDGRLAMSDDKINESNIRPVWKDDDLYTIKTVFTGTTDDEKAKAFIKAAVKARKDYKGSGDPSLYANEDIITDCLLLEDTTGRRLYNTITDLALAIRVKEIITVPVMDSLARTTADSKTRILYGLIVNLDDYNVGADKGGSVNMFDDFDIDYNAQKYLIETRCSGALIKPYSAIALEMETTP